ncbi:chalcone-flavanone isomerase-domain-containing protein [Gorgonomyces haynaldii]|nr:chalcone-flavanone isomerase-domain-containing protein [Gorgonomyces haynaldii]
MISHFLSPFRSRVFCDEQQKRTELLTNVQFPTLLNDYHLVFYVNVYAVALYCSPETRNYLRSHSRWTQEYNESKMIKGNPEGSWFVKDLAKQDLMLAVEPVRSTDWVHLRNGFTRLLSARLDTEKVDKREFVARIDAFKALFPKGDVKPGTRVLFHNKKSRLSVTIDDQTNFVEDPVLAQWFFEAYLSIDKPISPSFAQSLRSSLQAMVKPIKWL